MILYVSIISILSFITLPLELFWYAARFVHVIAGKVLVSRDEIEFLFIRNFHIFKVIRPNKTVVVQSSDQPSATFQASGWVFLQFSLDSFFCTALYVNASLVTLCLHFKNVNGKHSSA